MICRGLNHMGSVKIRRTSKMKNFSECIRTYPKIDDVPHAVCQECPLRKDNPNPCIIGNSLLKAQGFDL
jgi:hypothetical protein